MLDAKQDYFSNILGAKQDFCSIILYAKQDFCGQAKRGNRTADIFFWIILKQKKWSPQNSHTNGLPHPSEVVTYSRSVVAFLSNIFFNSQTQNENENEKKKEEAQIIKEKRKEERGPRQMFPLVLQTHTCQNK